MWVIPVTLSCAVSERRRNLLETLSKGYVMNVS
jgi:hypothetical protein